MENTKIEAKVALLRLEQTVQQLNDLDAGVHMEDPDQPMHEFNAMLDAAAREPVTYRDQHQFLIKGVTYLLRTEAGAPSGSLEDAMHSALGQAIAGAPDVLQAALLALVRHRLRKYRTSPSNA